MNIMKFVLDKNIGEKKYKNIFYEIKTGLLLKEYEKFPLEIKKRIYLDLPTNTGV